MTRAWTRTSRLALALSLAVSLAACSGEPGTAQVEDAWIRSNPNGMGAAYFTITLPSATALAEDLALLLRSTP
jgi:copper(I)-binding protein